MAQNLVLLFIPMSKLNTPKKPAPQDWHRADIKAALEKAGWTLRALSLAVGYSVHSLKACLHTPWPNAEAVIASALDMKPETIWPTRYNADGTPKRKRTERSCIRQTGRLQSSTTVKCRNVHIASGD